MKFYTSEISLSKPISLEEAVAKAKAQAPVRSLDEIIASAKQLKTAAAATAAETKTAAKVETPVEAPKVEAKAEEKVAEAKPKVEVKVAMEVEKKEAAAPAVAEQKTEPVVAAKEPEKKAAAKTVELKVAKELDFTKFEKPEEPIKLWGSFGNEEKCIASVKDKVSDPKTYCGLLKAAASHAEGMIKTAASKEAEGKKEASKAPLFKKLAKLTDKERSFLAKYFSKYYGEDYVKALLGDY